MNRRSPAHPLTRRERLVLDRIGRDRTHRAIAAELGASIIKLMANDISPLRDSAYVDPDARLRFGRIEARADHGWSGLRDFRGRCQQSEDDPGQGC